MIRIDIKKILKDHAYQNIPLNFDQAYELGLYALQGCKGDTLAQVQSIAALSALHNQATYAWQSTNKSHPHSAAEQIAGICAAIFEHDIAKSEFGYLNMPVPYIMDNCGMGGDLLVTANVSTIASFIAAAAGIHMCKHGSPANADGGRHGSSDFVSMCGLNTMSHRTAVETSVRETGFGYTEALDERYKRVHTQTHGFAQLPHMNDIIGPITNPVNPMQLQRRVLGVNHLIPVEVVAETYRILNQRGITNLTHGIFVRGYGDVRDTGMDELSICAGGTAVALLSRDHVIASFNLSAEDFGVETVRQKDISPPPGMSKGEFSMKILSGEIQGPPLQMVLANAALLLLIDERSSSLRECYQMAAEVHAQGLAFQKMQDVRKFLPID